MNKPSKFDMHLAWAVVCILVFGFIIWLWNDRNAYIDKLETSEMQCMNVEEILVDMDNKRPVPEWVWREFHDMEIVTIKEGDGVVSVISTAKYQRFGNMLRHGKDNHDSWDDIYQFYISNTPESEHYESTFGKEYGITLEGVKNETD